MKTKLLLVTLCVFLGACSTAQQHRDMVQDNGKGRLTVGKVQKQIQVGMPSSEVAGVLGSPNIVTTDEQRREVWVYDKISTESAYSTSNGGVSTLVLSMIPGINTGLGVSGGVNKRAGASSTSQRTLTVIVKFDDQSVVRDFAYHTSSF